MKQGLLLGMYLSATGYIADAQVNSNGYAALGMPTLVQRGLPVNPPAKIKTWRTEQLPRFWHTADAAARQRAAGQFFQALRQRIQYPKVALVHQLGGRVVVCVHLTPAGEPQRVAVRKVSFTLVSVVPEAEKALVNEAMRVAQLLRFRPWAEVADSLVFPVSFTCD
jgi:outer membrane biosynthesis protein TonB